MKKLLLFLMLALAASAAAQPYDLVITNGRVMDPESGLDAIRHIGITDGTIQAVSETPLEGRETLDATGRVVAPGFIDMNTYQHSTEWYHAYADAPNGERFAALAEALVENSVVVVPTLSITQASGLGADAALLPQFQVELAPDANVADWWSEGWRERHPQYDPDTDEEAEMMATVYFPGALNIVNGYYERGVRLAVGTDVGNSWMTPGVSFHHELGLYQDAGIPPLEILKMATHNGAEALGLLDEVGTITVGKRADLLVLGSDPSSNIHNTRNIENIFLAGKAMILHRPKQNDTFIE